MIYLDHAATTPLDPAALQAMLPWLEGGFGNPASDHAWGHAARAAVERARAQVAALIGAQADEIVWTSGATESNNLALKGALEFRGLRGAHLVTARSEHKSVVDPVRHLEAQGLRVTWLKPDAQGRIAVEQVLAALAPDTALVSLMWVNNETGVINPVEALAPRLRERGILFHVDAVQAAGKLPVDLAHVPIDLLSLSAHKLYGPQGIGALFVRKRPRARLSPQLHGSGHEQGMRSGTLPVHQIAGFGEACRVAAERLASDRERLSALRDRLQRQLQALPGVHLNGDPLQRAPGILNLSFAGVEGESLRASLGDLAVSSGSACSSATREPSYVLRALGRDDELAGASLRFSLGRATGEAEVDQAAARVAQAVRTLRRIAGTEPAAPVAPPHNAHGYSAPVWAAFAAPVHAATLPDGALAGTAGSPAGALRLRLQADLEQGRIARAAFQAYGCPVTIAVGEWLAAWLEGRRPEELRLSAGDLSSVLEISDDKAHCGLLGEDAVLALRRQMSVA
ncbi:aminotransferase class V-fold PLP-dependent enzyme [Solimonas sp. K1W22B-7]|uniref:aminotransferase class V-fold PLP-dependent enzyme n=1 Tax=Solimonas sp. K1W22B-7 TaxID=2303331 RepID=UPI000E32EBF4|nr:aminotransferase class V-fold PLP-dependent enzyme [Solimonas sp. K1W22B-7]AXQ29889.1 aminotransferase class V-fold PLP-dependent enzyme [Solimonas sp. K1W22B-7]